MSQRTKTTAKNGIESVPEFEQEIDTLAGVIVEKDQLSAEFAAVILKVKEKYAPKIKSIKKELDSRVKLCAAFAHDHRESIFAKGLKTSSTALANYGFRKGTPKAALYSKWTWEKVLQAINENGWQDDYARVSIDVNKEALIEVSKTEEGAEILKKIGVKITQSESFWITPKTDEPEPEKVEK